MYRQSGSRRCFVKHRLDWISTTARPIWGRKARRALAIHMSLLLVVVGFTAAGCGGAKPSEERVTMPRVVGLPLTLATQLLAERDIRWRAAGSDGTQVEPGTTDAIVVAQVPEAGTLVRADTIANLRTR